jgi:Cd2+/Zn2+-exporting ATPase
MSPEAARILQAAAASEQYSSHPAAEAIVAAARQHGLDIPEAINQRVEPGLGVSATVNDRSVIVGQLRFLRENLEVPEEFVQHTKELQARGLTVALVAYGDELAAFGLRDEPREYARQLVADLHALGSEHVQMITGDTKETAAAIAKEVGLDSFRAGLLPHEKNEIVGELASSGKTVMMVGDGVNDAPALASASIGVAMGGLGSDIALNSADVVLMHDRLESIPELIRLGRRTNRIVAANLIFATGVIAVLTIGSLFAELPLPLAVIGHEGSTVIVILNGLRLLRGPLKS